MDISDIRNSKILLDTNILIYTQDSLCGGFVTGIIQALVNGGNELIASNIAGFEILKKYSSNEEVFEPLLSLLNETPRLPVNVAVLRCAGKISHHLQNPDDKNSYKRDNDTIIAATALVNDCYLLTANINDFKMPLWSILANTYTVFDKQDGKGKGILNLFVLKSRITEVEVEKGITLVSK
jgi:predicted nucleic acid-binding protein